MSKVHGIIYPIFISEEAVDSLMNNNVVEEDDVFILTFPKCGTTMTQQIVHLINNNGVQPEKNMMEGVPWMEMCITQKTHDLKTIKEVEHRTYKTHANPHLFPGDWRKPK